MLLGKLLTQEEEQLVRVAVKVFGNIDRPADGITWIVEPEQLPRQAIAIIFPVVCVQPFVAVIQITAALEGKWAALGDHAALGPRPTSLFASLAAPDTFNLLNRSPPTLPTTAPLLPRITT